MRIHLTRYPWAGPPGAAEQRGREKTRQRTSFALMPEAATRDKGSGGCGAAYTVVEELVGKSWEWIHGQGPGVYGNIHSCKTRSA